MAGFFAWNLLKLNFTGCFNVNVFYVETQMYSNMCSVLHLAKNLINMEHSCHNNSISSILNNSSMSFVNF